MASHTSSREHQPLLQPLSSSVSYHSTRSTIKSDGTIITTNNGPSRSIEDDVLPETSTLGRTISWSSAYILVISRVVGSGIFATPGIIVKDVGSVGLSLLLWFVGAIIAACGLAVSLEYGCMLPRSGGEKVYLEFVYRRPRFLASTIIAVQAVLLGFTASNCIVFSQYTLYAFDIEATDFIRKSLAAGLLTAITIVHGCFKVTGIHIQNVLGWIKVGLVIFMIFTGLLVVVFGSPDTDGRRGHFPSGSKLWENTEWGWGVVSTSLFKVFYSFAGLNNVNNVMNEVKNPVRTLKTVSVSSLISACIMYMLINVAYFTVIPLEEIKVSRELVAALFFERCFGQRVGRNLIPLAVAASSAGNVMVVTFALARVNQEIARQGFLPYARLLASSKPFNAPLGGLIVHYLPSLLVIVLPPSKEAYSFILEVEGYPGQVFALSISLGLVWLRRKRMDLKRPFKAWSVAVYLRVVLSVLLLASPFFPPKEPRSKGGLWYATYAVVGISVIVFAILYWYVWFRLIPYWKGYRVEERTELLSDGTAVTSLVYVPVEK